MPDTTHSADALGELPVWDLDHLYPGPGSDELKRDLSKAGADAESFHGRLEGRLDSLDGVDLGTAIAEYERLDELLGRLMSYAYLVYAGDMSDPENGRFLQDMQEKVTEISAKLLFFTLELNRLDDEHLQGLMASSETEKYAPWLRDLRDFRPHQLSDELEQYIHDKSVTGRGAWSRLFDETMAELRFSINGKEMTSSEALNCLSDRDGALRKAAAESIGDVLGANVRLFAQITNTLAKDKQVDDNWRKFAEPWSSRNLANQVEDDVVDALRSAVRDAFPDISHRYYAWKAKQFGGEQLDYWDRNAPLPDDDDRLIPWTEARSIVLDAYGAFTQPMADVAQRFFDERWIDAPPRAGKSPGAFSHSTVPCVHPYVLLNYHGKSRDVMTLAHELGHGVHQVLAGDQGALMSNTPLTLAETASVFGEMLTFRSLVDRETDPKRKRSLLAGKVEDMINTVVRQIAFYEFERRVHAQRRSGELSAEQLGDIWMDVQVESLGPAIRFDDRYRVFWTYIPHFIHSPFYVYAYAFGDCLVNSLYAVYQDSGPEFAGKYLDMLRAGGTKRHKELLAPFGLDAGDPAFWHKGLSVIRDLQSELESME